MNKTCNACQQNPAIKRKDGALWCRQCLSNYLDWKDEWVHSDISQLGSFIED